jgi:hypothetical protein
MPADCPPACWPMAYIALAGNAGRTLLAECPGSLLAFFLTPQACALRLVCREFQAAVAAHPWEDIGTVIQGSIGAWRTCFPRARCVNVRRRIWTGYGGMRLSPVVDGDFMHLVGLRELTGHGRRVCAPAGHPLSEHDPL